MKLVDLLLRLKKIHRVYQVANEEQRGRLLALVEKGEVMDGLLKQGFTQDEVIGILIGGKDFIDSLGGVKHIDPLLFGELL